MVSCTHLRLRRSMLGCVETRWCCTRLPRVPGACTRTEDARDPTAETHGLSWSGVFIEKVHQMKVCQGFGLVAGSVWAHGASRDNMLTRHRTTRRYTHKIGIGVKERCLPKEFSQQCNRFLSSGHSLKKHHLHVLHVSQLIFVILCI